MNTTNKSRSGLYMDSNSSFLLRSICASLPILRNDEFIIEISQCCQLLDWPFITVFRDRCHVYLAFKCIIKENYIEGSISRSLMSLRWYWSTALGRQQICCWRNQINFGYELTVWIKLSLTSFQSWNYLNLQCRDSCLSPKRVLRLITYV